ncbi:MAG: hypothetical protein SCALA702_00680 [Melioribacteraceae bacterium]|nr:MAG: hypothetical protein SCALA702_00680 [Melioribacteraceae bacterium]
MTRVSSIEEFLQRIFAINAKKKNHFSIFFRGESQDYKNTKCQPPVFRDNKSIENEHNLFYDFISNNPDAFNKTKLTIEKLTLMQHYGLPTRLLDLSQNALTALYMACENELNNEGVVYIFLIPCNLVKHYYSDTISVLSNLSKRAKFNFPKDHAYSKEKFNTHEDIQFLLHDIKDEKPYFKDEIVPEHLYSVQCVIPLMNNRRIIQQQGAFLIFGNDKEDKFKNASFKNSGIELIPIYIHKKSEIIKNLELMGINKAFIYPDMEKIANYLINKYTK